MSLSLELHFICSHVRFLLMDYRWLSKPKYSCRRCLEYLRRRSWLMVVATSWGGSPPSLPSSSSPATRLSLSGKSSLKVIVLLNIRYVSNIILPCKEKFCPIFVDLAARHHAKQYQKSLEKIQNYCTYAVIAVLFLHMTHLCPSATLTSWKTCWNRVMIFP